MATYPWKCKDCLNLQMKHGSVKASYSWWLYCLGLFAWRTEQLNSRKQLHQLEVPNGKKGKKKKNHIHTNKEEIGWLRSSGSFFELKIHGLITSYPVKKGLLYWMLKAPLTNGKWENKTNKNNWQWVGQFYLFISPKPLQSQRAYTLMLLWSWRKWRMKWFCSPALRLFSF